MIALILAGGAGKRFWPLSNEYLPKQYLTLFDNKSMLKLTYERLIPFISKENIFVVTTHDQIPLVYDYLPELNACQIIDEPHPMNTGPCIALSIANLLWNFKRDERVLVLPADHYIPDTTKFIETVKIADTIAKDNFLITFGVKPTHPATGYGYIEIGNIINVDRLFHMKQSVEMFHVKQFKEKPDFEKASRFLQQGNFLWNSGMFCFSIFNIIESFEKYNKEMFDKIVEISCLKDSKIKKEQYMLLEKLPIDIAIFEKADNVAVLPVDFIWSDVGTWSSLSDLKPKDENKNHFQGNSFVIDSKNNTIFSDKNVALIGVGDLIVVENNDSLLICKKDLSELVKDVNF